MKKLLVIVLSVTMVLVFAAVSMAEVTFGGEIDAGYKGYSSDTYNDQSMSYLFAKLIANVKLGDSVTGLMVIKNADADITDGQGTTDPADPKSTNQYAAASNLGSFAFDEASITIAQPFGNIKAGYYNWNPNLKDVISGYRGDLKNDVNVGATINIMNHFSLDFAYGIPTTDKAGNTDGTNAAKYGVRLAYTTDHFGADVNYSSNTFGAAGPITTLTDKNGDACTITGVDVWYFINGFKPYIQYEVVNDTTYKDDPTNIILGFIYDSADVPVYGRFEYDLSDSNGKEQEMGVRVGYKFESGVKLQGQYKENINGTKDSKEYIKLVLPF